MSDFLSNTVSNLVGTFVGAGLALLSAWGVARRERARSEIRRLQRLIDRVYRSRALVLVPDCPVQTSPLDDLQQRDFQRVTASVLTTRDLIGGITDSLDAGRPVVAVLDDMYAATLKYLNTTEVDSRDYVNELMRLRNELFAGEQRLQQLHPKLVLREPGGVNPDD
jgi:hypothetical protein